MGPFAWQLKVFLARLIQWLRLKFLGFDGTVAGCYLLRSMCISMSKEGFLHVSDGHVQGRHG